MKQDKLFYSEFLSELKALDDFLLHGGHKTPFVARTDPDVRRLMESMAFFSARSRTMAVDGFARAVTRISAGHLEELMRARPARALVRAHPDPRMVEPVRLPAGSKVRLVVDNQAFDGAGPGEKSIVGLFSTTCTSSVLPLEIKSAKLGLRAGSGFRIMVEMRAFQPMYWRPDPLSFHTSVLADYDSSRRFLYAMEQHMQAASVVYGDAAPEPDAAGTPCEVAYGLHPKDERDEHPDPLASVSRFLHFPEEELFFHVHLPERERPWRRAWLCLDMDEDWPASLPINKDVFQLFVFPVSNARREPAEPILCDGTQDDYPIRPVGPGTGDSLHRVAGVYREVETGWQPLLPEHLSPITSDEAGTYELENDMMGGAETEDSRLYLNIPDAFDNPCKIAVDAYFYQPWFDNHAYDRLRVALQTRKVDGVRWELVGNLREHRPSPLVGKPFDLLHLLSLVGQSTLTFSDIKYVLEFMGADRKGQLGPVLDLMTGVRLTEERSRAGDGTEYIYHVSFKDDDDEDTAASRRDLCAQLNALLDAWSRRPVRVLVANEERGGKKRLAR